MKKIIKISVIASALLGLSLIKAIDNAHFYRASNALYPIYEPRLTKPWLTSFDATVGHGSTDHAFGRHELHHATGCRTPLLNLYGPHNMHELGAGVPGKDPTNPLDLALINLEAVPTRECFGQLLFLGDFAITEANFIVTQNLTCGLFLQAHLPVRRISISCTRFRDLSPTDTIFPNAKTPQWVTFLSLFDQILERYNIDAGPVRERGVGDLSLLVGWSYHYNKTKIIDFFDACITIGCLTPTGKKKNEDKAFSLPLGYDGHVGFPLHVSAAFGCYGWLNVGFHAYALIFGDKTRTIRLKTNAAQNGFITLAQGSARVDAGTLWGAHGYFKADHIIKGLSLLVGYSFDEKSEDRLTVCDPTTFNGSIANSDQIHKRWFMHTIHFMGEYDFATEELPYGPRINAFFNLVAGGKRVFKTGAGGIGIGLDCAW